MLSFVYISALTTWTGSKDTHQITLSQSHTCFHTTSGLSSHTPGARKEAGYTLCTSTQSSWTLIHSPSCQLPPVPASRHTHTHTHTHRQTDIHLQVDTWLYPLTCNFRHRCAGRPHIHTHVRSHTDTDHKISDREHMCSHGICLMTLTLLCTPALHRIFRQHTHTHIHTHTHCLFAPMPLANRFGSKASAKKINVNVIGNAGVIGLSCPPLYKRRDSLFDMVIIKGQWECC